MAYKLIQECGLHVFQAFRNNDSQSSGKINCVYAADLEAFLAKGVRVYNDGERTDEYWDNAKYHKNTHTALVIDYKPIQKLEPVSKEELLKLLRSLDNLTEIGFRELIERIEKAGIR